MLQFILLQAAPGGGSNTSMIFLLLIPVVMYFFMIRPQQKQMKERKELNDSLKEGMEVVTNSGIIGRITKIDDKTARLMVDEKTFLRVTRQSIAAEYKA